MTHDPNLPKDIGLEVSVTTLTVCDQMVGHPPVMFGPDRESAAEYLLRVHEVHK